MALLIIDLAEVIHTRNWHSNVHTAAQGPRVIAAQIKHRAKCSSIMLYITVIGLLSRASILLQSLTRMLQVLEARC